MIVGYQPSGVPSRRQLIVDQLTASGIITLGDLDKWRGNRSRYQALVLLVGEDSADLALNELAIRQCNHVADGRDYWRRQYDDTGARGGALL